MAWKSDIFLAPKLGRYIGAKKTVFFICDAILEPCELCRIVGLQILGYENYCPDFCWLASSKITYTNASFIIIGSLTRVFYEFSISGESTFQTNLQDRGDDTYNPIMVTLSEVLFHAWLRKRSRNSWFSTYSFTGGNILAGRLIFPFVKDKSIKLPLIALLMISRMPLAVLAV